MNPFVAFEVSCAWFPAAAARTFEDRPGFPGISCRPPKAAVGSNKEIILCGGY